MQVLIKRNIVDNGKTFVPEQVVQVEGNLQWDLADCKKMEKKKLITIIDEKPAKVGK